MELNCRVQMDILSLPAAYASLRSSVPFTMFLWTGVIARCALHHDEP